jgi:uncharacterized Fe-S cluster-containing radical SAM superfamily protein
MYCPDIHHNLSILLENDTVLVGPCCDAVHHPVEFAENLFDTARLVELRQTNNKENKLTNDCASCSRTEQSGGRSRRIAQLDFYQGWNKSGIRALDLRLGNLCNLACVVCGPRCSSTWVDDAEKLGIEIKPEWRFKKNQQFNVGWLSSNKNLEMVHFTGGEPLIDERHLDFIKNLDTHNILQNVRLTYNTNGTHFPSDEVVEYWSRAHSLELYFSIDDTGARYEYQRYGANWELVIQNLNDYYSLATQNHLFYFTITWSFLNIYYLPEIVNWLGFHLPTNRFGNQTQFCFNHAYGFCEITKVSSKIYKILEDRFKDFEVLQPVLKSLTIDDNFNCDIFKNYIAQLDQIRSNSYKNTHPEWAELIGL